MALNHSCLYDCEVMHQRLSPKRHRFQYNVFQFYLDLDELSELPKASLGLIQLNRWGLYSFNEADHPVIPDGGTLSLKDRVQRFATEAGHILPGDIHRVMLLTNLRVFGYGFNPVSFYFCFDAFGEVLGAVAEVGNTFHEQKVFWVPRVKQTTVQKQDLISLPYEVPLAKCEAKAIKAFYVSPFSPLTFGFHFRLECPLDAQSLERPSDKLVQNFLIAVDTIKMSEEGVNPVVPKVLSDENETQQQGVPVDPLVAIGGTCQTVLVATLQGKPVRFSVVSLLKLTLQYPFVTIKVIGLIHLEALRLWFKRIPFYRKEDSIEQQTQVLNPHASLGNVKL